MDNKTILDRLQDWLINHPKVKKCHWYKKDQERIVMWEARTEGYFINLVFSFNGQGWMEDVGIIQSDLEGEPIQEKIFDMKQLEQIQPYIEGLLIDN